MIQRLLHKDMRVPKSIAWVKALLKPLYFMKNDFTAYRAAVKKELSYNYQVIYLEKGLNDRFNAGLPAYINPTLTSAGTPVGIYIDHVNDIIAETYLYWQSENAPETYLYWEIENEAETHLYWQSEIDAQIDFIVYFPWALGDVTDVVTNAVLISQIKAFIVKYKLPGYKYKLMNY